jgi:hypothetical protein
MPLEDGRETPYELAQRYAAGELTRDDLVRRLAEYDYLPQDPIPDDTVDIAEHVEGSWDEVEQAVHDKLIDYETYDAILRAAGAR